MPRGVYERHPGAIHRKQIRTLRPDEPRPDWVPSRYPDRDGYIRLRWKVGVQSYVEVREHRTTAPTEHHVHHLDGNKANNEPSNLVVLTPSEHARLHGMARRRFDRELAAELYRSGLSLPQVARRLGVHHVTVLRALREEGVQMRPRPGWRYA